MERRSVSEIIEQYTPLLRKYENDQKLVILEAEEDYGTKAGENYLSIVLRTKIKGKQGNGSPYEKSFMRKLLLQNPHIAKLMNNDNMFIVESHVYKKILPRLGPFGPACILAEPNEIIMEDLGSRNFSICDRRKLLDSDHCVAVIEVFRIMNTFINTETLAALHASSMKIKLQDPEGFLELVTPLRENMFVLDKGFTIGSFFESGLTYAFLSLESVKTQKPEAQYIIDCLKNYEGNVHQKMLQLLVPRSNEDQRYWVITHGDTWNNNILFLHNPDGTVAQVKLVDYQICRHSSPAFDFTYFLYASARSDVLDRDTDKLIDIYERLFLHNLRRMEVSEEDLEAFKKPGWFREQLKYYGAFGFFGSMMVLHAIFMDEELAEQYESSKMNSDFDFENHKAENMPLSPEKSERLFCIADHFIRKLQHLN